MFNVKYIVLPENRLVVCEIRDEFDNRFRGVAKCNVTDTFNEEVGKNIAFSRANLKRKKHHVEYLRYEKHFVEIQLAYLEAKRRQFEKKINKVQATIANANQEINAIVNQNN